MSKGDTITTPYVYDSGPDANGNSLVCSFRFNNGNRQLTVADLHRDTGCLYLALLIGNPNSSPTRMPASGALPEGDSSTNRGQMLAAGFDVFEDVVNWQITATA